MATRSQAIKSDVAAEASAWFVEFRAGDMTSATRARFDDWLRRSPEHIQAYLDVAASWSELPTADPEGRIDIEALLARARTLSEENVISLSSGEYQAHRPQGSRRIISRLAASAAALALLLTAGTWLLVQRGTTYSTGVGEQRTVMLADGSTVVLNALTTVRTRITKRVREVDLLQGQALFHDVEDRTRPFFVRSDDTTIRAIGTQFDVSKHADSTVVTVVEGEVAVAEAIGASVPDRAMAPTAQPRFGSPKLVPVLLSAGDQAIATPERIEKTQHVDVPSATAWVEGRLVFDNTPLAQVAEQFNIYSSRKLVIADPALRLLGISGVYSSADPDSLIGFLRAQPDLLVTQTPAEFRVSSRTRTR